MIYKNLPKVGELHLPELQLVLTGNSSPRFGLRPARVWEHTWGGGTLPGVESWFENPTSQASAHFVYAGEKGKFAGQCVQMVLLSRKAWTEAFYNRRGISFESADAVWQGKDPEGFARLARMSAWVLRYYALPPKWIRWWETGKGISRHADGGMLGGGHFSCPTKDLELFRQFVTRVERELEHGHFRTHWAKIA